jgi:hypothetical protein
VVVLGLGFLQEHRPYHTTVEEEFKGGGALQGMFEGSLVLWKTQESACQAFLKFFI